jgi:hypothetical protein
MIQKDILIAFFTIVTTTAIALAQEQTIDIHFNALGFLDNREYKALYCGRAPIAVFVPRLI